MPYLDETKRAHYYSEDCKNCTYFDIKKRFGPEYVGGNAYFENLYKEKVYLCEIADVWVTESGKLPVVMKCSAYREDKFLSAFREIIKKHEEEENGI